MPTHARPPQLPGDNHVHSEWSWDAEAGAMEASCARAASLGLPAIAFTEHWDPTPCPIDPAAVPHLPPLIRGLVSPQGVFLAPALDVEGYVARLAECRERFPRLRILSGVELGEPHWWPESLAALVRRAEFDRILGSVHCIKIDGRYQYVEGLYGRLPPGEVVRLYLAEVLRLVESPCAFAILAHIDYPVRDWPKAAEPYQVEAFEDEYRTVLRALAISGRALEVNTTVPLPARVVRWWHEASGKAISFGSDAHEPAEVARGFIEAAAMAEAAGFATEGQNSLWVRQ